MRAVILATLVVVAYGCVTPPQWEAREIAVDPSRGFDVYRHIHYDATNQRIARYEDLRMTNEHEQYYVIDLFRPTGMEYRLNVRTRQCEERPIRGTFQPIEVPPSSKLVDQFSIGLENKGTRVPGEGVDVLTYYDEIEGSRILITVTKEGCIPVSFAVFSEERAGFITSSFFNVTAGIKDPDVFNKPSECQ